MTSASTSTITDTSNLVSSTSSLGASQNASPNISRIYKEASQLFLTRRIHEALQILQPIIEPAASGDNSTTPIASASRGARIKVWSLYVSILNEVMDMGSEEGRQTFGAQRWKELASKAKDGKIWEEVTQLGYGGHEGDVDADVVANLATLLLTHAPSQRLTQQRLESYLSASGTPSLDVAGHMERPKPARSNTNGTSTPRDLNSRLKILEIYTLHVLPRNEEWDYAREFINMSEVIDDDRREAFINALQSIRDEKDLDARREAELQKQREQQQEDSKRRDAEAARKAQETRDQEEKRKKQESSKNSERDFGVDKSKPNGSPKTHSKAASGPSKQGGNSKAPSNKEKTSPAKKGKATPSGLYQRAGSLLEVLQRSLIAMGQNAKTNPMALLRMLAFLLALLLALARRDVRDRLSRIREQGWNKVKQTVGMGVKVSYI